MGKSHDLGVLGRMQTPEGAVIFNFAENAENALFETVLDADKAGRSVYKIVEERLAEKTLNPLSFQILKETFGEHFTEKDDGTAIIAWGDVKLSADKAAHPAFQALEKVRGLERLDAGLDSLPIKTRFGPLIRAWNEGRPFIGEEYMRTDPSTDAKLYPVWEVLIGQSPETTVEGAGGLKFTFRRKDMKPGFFCDLTGNMKSDGVGIKDRDYSEYSRLQPRFVPDATKEDYEHQISHMLTGLPLSTLNKLPLAAGLEPKKATAFWKSVRHLGLSPAEKENVPDWHYRMIEKQADVLQAARQLAGFYKDWDNLLDPESPNRPSEIMMEVDEQDRRRLGSGLRMIIDHVNEALKPRPHSIPLSQSAGLDVTQDWSQPPAVSPSPRVTPDRFLGTNLELTVLQAIENASLRQGKPNLHKLLLQKATDHGITGTSFAEATANPNLKPISKLLDNDPYKGLQLSPETETLQKILCAQLREFYPQLKGSDDSLIKPLDLQLCVNRLEEERKSLETPTTKFLCVGNPHFLEGTVGDSAPSPSCRWAIP